jgi:hypothetical protein
VALYHAKYAVTFLCYTLAIINPIDCERVLKDPLSHLESDAMSEPIGLGLSIVPFKSSVLHIYGIAVVSSSVENFITAVSLTCPPPWLASALSQFGVYT